MNKLLRTLNCHIFHSHEVSTLSVYHMTSFSLKMRPSVYEKMMVSYDSRMFLFLIDTRNAVRDHVGFFGIVQAVH